MVCGFAMPAEAMLSGSSVIVACPAISIPLSVKNSENPSNDALEAMPLMGSARGESLLALTVAVLPGFQRALLSVAECNARARFKLMIGRLPKTNAVALTPGTKDCRDGRRNECYAANNQPDRDRISHSDCIIRLKIQPRRWVSWVLQRAV
jgi:hypothetical protein